MANTITVYGTRTTLIKHGAPDMLSAQLVDAAMSPGNYGQSREVYLNLGLAGKCHVTYAVKDKNGGILIQDSALKPVGASSILLFNTDDLNPTDYAYGSKFEIQLLGNIAGSQVVIYLNIAGGTVGGPVDLVMNKSGGIEASTPFLIEAAA